MADSQENIDPVDAGIDTPEPAVAKAPAPAAPEVRLNGLQKAAVLMVTLGPERAASIMKHLDADEADPLIVEVAHMQNLPPEYVYVVTNEVVETALARGYFYEGGPNYARDMLVRAFGQERADELMGRLRNVIETRPFKFLSRTSPEQIYTFVRNEHPQLIALLLAHLSESQSAKVLEMFAPERQADIVRRIATMGQTTPEMVAQVENTIRAKMHVVAVSETAHAGGVEAAADLINQVDRQTERNVFDTLEDDNPSLAEEIRALLFVFEDITSLESQDIQQIVQNCEQADMALALRGASQETQRIFYENMSERMAETIQEEIEIMKPQKRSEVEAAQSRIVGVARGLEAEGNIQIARGGDADEVI